MKKNIIKEKRNIKKYFSLKMSLVVSPKSGKLIKTTGKAYAELLNDPKYKDFLVLNPSKSPKLEKGTVKPSGLPPLKNMANLPPLPVSPTQPRMKLPPLPASPRRKTELPPLPASPVYSPPSPSSSLTNVPMQILPPLPVSKSSKSPLPILKVPTKASPVGPQSKNVKFNLPPLAPSLGRGGKMEKTIPSPRMELPPLSPKVTLPPLEVSGMEEMRFADIPTLEETLKHTRQPARRAKLEAMIKEKKYEEGRGIKTRGWAARAPTKGKERHQLHAECGDKCFLLPESEKFPICASPRMGEGCAVDCGGVQNAYIRAKQWGYDVVAKKAEALLQVCNKEGLKHFVPSVLPPLPSKSSNLPPLSPRKELPPLSPSMQTAGLMPRRVARRTARRVVRRTSSGELSPVSPSMSTYGSGDRKDEKEQKKGEKGDCGCGN